MSKELMRSCLARYWCGVAGIVLGLGLAALPSAAWGAVDCKVVTSGESPDVTTDSDGDGFTDYQECKGILLAGGAEVQSCVAPDTTLERSSCLHPDSKDLFVIYAPASTGSLLVGADPRMEILEPFKVLPTNYGITFNGLASLGVTIHQVSPGQVSPDRTVTSLQTDPPSPLLSTQKAVRISENLDNTGSTLGYCQYGTPNGLDGCTVYTRRIIDFIISTCAGLAIVLPDGRTPSDAESVFKAYAAHTILHEVGHTLGGLTASYNSRYGGYHYSSGTIMEQYVVVTTKSGKCKFAISNEWNLSLDPPAVKLK